FTPTAGRAHTASLALAEPGGATDTVALAGTGATSALATDRSVVDFFNQAVGTTSPPEPVVVKNTSPVALNVSSVTTTGPNAAEFGISADGCQGAVAPGATCTVGVRFFPSAT